MSQQPEMAAQKPKKADIDANRSAFVVPLCFCIWLTRVIVAVPFFAMLHVAFLLLVCVASVGVQEEVDAVAQRRDWRRRVDLNYRNILCLGSHGKLGRGVVTAVGGIGVYAGYWRNLVDFLRHQDGNLGRNQGAVQVTLEFEMGGLEGAVGYQMAAWVGSRGILRRRSQIDGG
jgi:hypothetical protein